MTDILSIGEPLEGDCLGIATLGLRCASLQGQSYRQVSGSTEQIRTQVRRLDIHSSSVSAPLEAGRSVGELRSERRSSQVCHAVDCFLRVVFPLHSRPSGASVWCEALEAHRPHSKTSPAPGSNLEMQ